MAISTYKVFLMSKSGGSYEKLVDIKDFPDLGAAPEMIQTTTLSDKAHTYIPGIQGVEGMEFTANYTLDDFKKLDALAGTEKDFAVWFGGTESAGTVTPTGSEGKYEFKGYLSVYVAGGGVNAVVDMKISIAPSTVIVQTAE